MKRFVLVALICLASCVQFDPPQEIGMPSTYTPNPANNPATITLPTAGDPVASAVADQAWKDIADKDARKIQGAISGQVGTIEGVVQVVSGGAIDFQNPSALTLQAGAVEVHNNTESHTGHEFHTGQEDHSGVVAFGTNAVTCNAGLDVHGGLNSDATILNGTTTVTGEMHISGAGHIRYRYLIGVNSDHTYHVADADVIEVDASATRKYTLSKTGLLGGESITIINDNATNAVQVYQHDGTTLIATLKDASGFFASAEFINDGFGAAATSWRVKMATLIP